jgi:hypothetical protein
MKLRGSGNSINIEVILNNPVFRQAIFEKLSK